MTRQPRTLADWLQALEASGWKGRKAGREWCGPCPRCGGVDRFHVGPGARVAVVAGCRHGCTFEALAETLFGARTVRRGARCRRVAGGTVGRRAERGPTRPKTRPKGENASGGDSRGFGGGGPPKRPTSGGPAENEAVESPLTHDRAPPRGRGAPAIGPDRAAALWSRSGPVPLGFEHPARRWAARRHLWPKDRAWPEAVRWLPHPDGGSLVAAFAPVADWTEAHPPAPTGVQLLHLDAEGRPQEDRGGLSKRSLGTMTAAVCVTGAPVLRTPEALHVVEGIADALAVAA